MDTLLKLLLRLDMKYRLEYSYPKITSFEIFLPTFFFLLQIMFEVFCLGFGFFVFVFVFKILVEVMILAEGYQFEKNQMKGILRNCDV